MTHHTSWTSPRLPGCRHVKVIYRRGPGEIPAREIELHHAIKEGVEFLYHTQQVAVIPRRQPARAQMREDRARRARRRRAPPSGGDRGERARAPLRLGDRRGRAARHLRGAPPGGHDGAGPGTHRVGFLGATRPGPNAPWVQLCEPGRDAPSHDATGVVYRVGERRHPMPTTRARAEQLLGLLLASRRDPEDAIVYALERGFDLLVLDGTGALGGEWPELRAAPDLARETIAILRRLKKEEMIDIAWFGGARSGTDAAKLVGLGG